jgi:hypothetical protein
MASISSANSLSHFKGMGRRENGILTFRKETDPIQGGMMNPAQPGVRSHSGA